MLLQMRNILLNRLVVVVDVFIRVEALGLFCDAGVPVAVKMDGYKRDSGGR